MDATNAGTPAPGGQLSGDVTRMAAIKRMQKLQKVEPVKPGAPYKAAVQSGPNTGATGLPKPGGGLVQQTGLQAYSATPKKKGII